MTRPESRGFGIRETVTSVVGVLGAAAVLGGLVVVGGKAAEHDVKISEQLNVAAKHDGFQGIDTPAFVESSARASSALKLGRCMIQPVIMHYRTLPSGELDITKYAFEGSVYPQDAPNKHLNDLLNDDETLDITFRTEAELQTIIGEDPCHVLEPVLAARNLQLS